MSTPSAAEALARLRHELAHPPFHAVLRPQALEADPATGRVAVRLPYRPDFGRAAGSGHVHGGVIAALIDLTAHAAVAVQTQRMAPTIDLRIDYLRPAPAGDLIARGHTLQLGRTIARTDVEVVDAADGRVVAVGRGTFSVHVPSPKE
ncbi:MAG: PaaI family thioesterase [Pigmentiphaga sp.]|uniref:PaaI family thioesterase n=1 Tax=Pigmentiphaga sp. TaxID=1977564 RepID=UPI0029B32719|nr:PaaI family thioesterase [Pigmentiphaga sp.]MDX3908044.1 PaaI family thioesterase [Pigmentiphaga sp.]